MWHERTEDDDDDDNDDDDDDQMQIQTSFHCFMEIVRGLKRNVHDFIIRVSFKLETVLGNSHTHLYWPIFCPSYPKTREMFLKGINVHTFSEGSMPSDSSPPPPHPPTRG